MITQKAHIFLVITVAITGSLLYFYFNPEFHNFFPPCPFHQLTGLYCPGCGSQRAMHHLLHGRLGASADHNILFIAALPVIGYSAAVTTYNIFGKRKIKQLFFQSPHFAWIVLIIVVAFWVLRNVPVFPFLWLAP